MTDFLGTMQLGVLATLGFAVMAAVVSAILYPLARRRLISAEPAARTRRLFAWAAAPSLLAIVLTTLCFLPSALDLLGAGSDHCPVHGDHHPHLCLIHGPDFHGSVAGWLFLTCVGAVCFIAVARRLGPLVRTRRVLRFLAVVGRRDTRGLQVVDSEVPLSMTAGILHPTIYVSSGLVRSLPADQLEVIAEHERAHVRRRDGLVQLLASVLSISHLPRIRRQLLADLALASEQACDEDAARCAGDRIRVASTILTVERMFADHAPRWSLAVSSFEGSNIVARVEALLSTPPEAPPRGYGTGLFLALLAVGFFMAGPLHHVAETVLGLLMR